MTTPANLSSLLDAASSVLAPGANSSARDEFGIGAHEPKSEVTNITGHPYDYYETSYKWVGITLGTIIFLTGFVGNIMVITVVTYVRSMRSSTNCYLVSLASADLMTLISATLPFIVDFFFYEDEWPYGAASCYLHVFISYLAINTSALSITAFSIERYIAICYPMKAQTLCTIGRAKKIIFSLWIFAALYCSPWFILVNHWETLGSDGVRRGTCGYRYRNNPVYFYIYFADLMFYYIIPLVVSCVVYSLVARILFKGSMQGSAGRVTRGGAACAPNNVRYGSPPSPSPSSSAPAATIVHDDITIMEEATTIGTDDATSVNEIGVKNRSALRQSIYRVKSRVMRHSRDNGKYSLAVPKSPHLRLCAPKEDGSKSPQPRKSLYRKSDVNKSRVQVVKMLAVVVITFALLWMPYRGINTVNNLYRILKIKPWLDRWYFLFAKLSVYLSSAVNPILYNLLSVKFRRAFKRVLGCGRVRGPQLGRQNTMARVNARGVVSYNNDRLQFLQVPGQQGAPCKKVTERFTSSPSLNAKEFKVVPNKTALGIDLTQKDAGLPRDQQGSYRSLATSSTRAEEEAESLCSFAPSAPRCADADPSSPRGADSEASGADSRLSVTSRCSATLASVTLARVLAGEAAPPTPSTRLRAFRSQPKLFVEAWTRDSGREKDDLDSDDRILVEEFLKWSLERGDEEAIVDRKTFSDPNLRSYREPGFS